LPAPAAYAATPARIFGEQKWIVDFRENYSIITTAEQAGKPMACATKMAI